MIKLIGVLIVILSFVFKLETLFIVLVARLATEFVAGMDLNEILTVLG